MGSGTALFPGEDAAEEVALLAADLRLWMGTYTPEGVHDEEAELDKPPKEEQGESMSLSASVRRARGIAIGSDIVNVSE